MAYNLYKVPKKKVSISGLHDETKAWEETFDLVLPGLFLYGFIKWRSNILDKLQMRYKKEQLSPGGLQQ